VRTAFDRDSGQRLAQEEGETRSQGNDGGSTSRDEPGLPGVLPHTLDGEAEGLLQALDRSMAQVLNLLECRTHLAFRGCPRIHPFT
jgi:hypothetical protein